MSSHEMLELAPLYALDALEVEEQLDFEAHLETCAACRSTLGEYQAVAANLVHDEPPSPETWQRISEAIATEGEVSSVAEIRRTRPDPIWKWLSAVAAAVAVVLGGVIVFDDAEPGRLESEEIIAAANEAAGQPGTFNGAFRVDDATVARVVLSADGQGFVIPTQNLEALDDERTYQLWVVNHTEDVISAGVLGNHPAPATFTWTGEVEGFALTREVAGGVVSSAGDVVSVISDV